MTFITNNHERLRIDHDGRALLGAVRTYDTGTYYDDITINNSNTTSGAAGGAGISLVSGNDSWGGLIFSDSDMHGRGYLKYDHGDDELVFGTASNNRLFITSSGHVIPGVNNTQDLGSTAKGWRNIYTNDLNLSNMNGEKNDIDGTQGSWTIQEGKDNLYIINRLNGKKFKIKMEEIS